MCGGDIVEVMSGNTTLKTGGNSDQRSFGSVFYIFATIELFWFEASFEGC